jgi:HK97 family phage major capsid protein
MNTPLIPQTSIGQHDPARRERLLALIDVAERRNSSSVSLRWPDQTAELAATGRRDIDAWDPNGKMLTFGQQIRRHSAIARCGASFVTLPGIQTSELPTIDRSKKAAWVTSSADVAPTLDLVDSTPLRLSAFIRVSQKLLKTSALLAGGFLEAQLLSAIGAAIDESAILGSGTGEPYGLKTDPAIAELSIAGATPTFVELTEMERLVSANHGETDSEALRWLVDPATRKALRVLPRIATKEVPTWPDDPKSGPLGIRGIASPWASASTCILGNFADLQIIQSGALEVFQPEDVSDAKSGWVSLFAVGWFDIVALNPAKSFVRAVAP